MTRAEDWARPDRVRARTRNEVVRTAAATSGAALVSRGALARALRAARAGWYAQARVSAAAALHLYAVSDRTGCEPGAVRLEMRRSDR